MTGVWKLPANYVGTNLVMGLEPHRYRISYEGRDPLVQVDWDRGNCGLASGTTLDVTGIWIKIKPNGDPRNYALAGEYESLD